MPFAAFLTEHIRGNTDSVIPHPKAKLPWIVADFNFDSPRLGVVKGVAQRFARNPVDLVPQDRVQVLRRALHFQGKSGCVPGGIFMVCGELLTHGFNRLRQVILGSGGPAHVLNRVPRFADGLSGIVDRGFEYLPCIRGAPREQVHSSLKARQQPMEAL